MNNDTDYLLNSFISAVGFFSLQVLAAIGIFAVNLWIPTTSQSIDFAVAFFPNMIVYFLSPNMGVCIAVHGVVYFIAGLGIASLWGHLKLKMQKPTNVVEQYIVARPVQILNESSQEDLPQEEETLSGV